MKRILLLLSLVTVLRTAAQPWSERMGATALRLWPDSFLLAGDKTAKWRYDQGVILKGLEEVWKATGDGRWFRYIQQQMDFYVKDDGSIRGYRPDEYNIDHVNNGKVLLMLYQVTGKEKYKKAADRLREQLRTHPRTREGGFWHKKIYPWQMWLDGLYMGQPFYAEYAKLFHEDTIFNDVARQFILMEKNGMDKKSGFLRHGWDESREQAWADKGTGLSPHVWGRSLGWFGMALVDALEYFPEKHPQRSTLITILHRFAVSARRLQQPNGLWYDIPDLPQRAKNYPEASASCMLAYTLAKGARLGYIPGSYAADARRAWQGIQKTFVEITPSGDVNLKGTVAVSGLGGNPYRNGSYDYYMGEPVIVNDPKGLGSFILCAAELERGEVPPAGRGKTVLLDYYFNNEWKKDATGKRVRWHYTWEDRTNSGYSLLGELFRRQGARTRALTKWPTVHDLRGASVYIIVDPDTEKETDSLNRMSSKDIISIREWVKAGGLLVLLGNDAGNAEFKNFNHLAGQFGIRFNEDSKNRVQGDQFEQGAVFVPEGHSIFGNVRQLYIKELSTLTLSPPAIPVLQQSGDVVMAISRYGKGMVFALGDPWIYNEYLDGRKLPADFDNYPAAVNWVKWLLKQAK
jgi:unsaturated rhamnogalacturonyl hydrolase